MPEVPALSGIAFVLKALVVGIVAIRAVDVAATGPLDSARDGPVTFAKDVAPIIFDRCGTCHPPDGPAPLSLLTYAAVRQRATLIAAVTKSRFMPPWKSEPGYGEFIGHRPLGDAEIGVMQQWAADGAPEGDPRDLPPAPQWIAGWQLGKPDLIVTLSQPYVLQADGTDVSRVFVLPVPVRTMRAAAQAALGLKPADPDAVAIRRRQDLYRQRKPYVSPVRP